MIRVITFAAVAMLLSDCAKHSEAVVPTPGSVSSIVYSDTLTRKQETYGLLFQGQQLQQIRVGTSAPDLQVFNSPVRARMLVYAFRYGADPMRPVSYVVTDTLSEPPVIDLSVMAPVMHLLAYDNLGRIAEDSLSGPPASTYGITLAKWIYHPGGIGVYFYNKDGLFYTDSVAYVGDIDGWYEVNWASYQFGRIRNPLYDPALAATIGPLMFDMWPDELTPLSIPIDFFSKYLPAGGSCSGLDLGFTWTKNAFGQVTGGTENIRDPSNGHGLTTISFRYR